MMKALSISTLFLTVAASSFAISALPDGTWSGGGTYHTSTGKSGTYTETLNVKNNVITKAVTKDGKTWTAKVTVTFDKNGFTTGEGTATSPTGKVHELESEGMCAQTANVCTFWSQHEHFGGTVAFGKDKNVYELGGAKGHKKLKVRWDGVLKPVTE